MLLKVKVFHSLVCVAQIKLGKSTLLQKIRLGWITTGSIIPTNNIKILNCNLSIKSEV